MTLFWLGVGWLGGIVAGALFPMAIGRWLILAGVCLAFAVFFRRQAAWPMLFASLALAFGGAARTQASQLPPAADHVVHLMGFPGEVILTGVVVASPDVRERYTGLRVEVEEVRRVGEPAASASGKVLIYAARSVGWAYGDRIRARGLLEIPPEDEGFSYRGYLARRGILAYMPRADVQRLAAGGANPVLAWIFSLRQRGIEVVQRLFPDPESALLAGILLGADRGLPEGLRRAYEATGTSHIIAISGFNITILSGFFVSVLGRALGARRGGLAAGLGIGAYAILVGGDASVVRAAIMGGLSLLALRLGRTTHALASLSAAAIVMTAVRPASLWEAGFQLSFAATLGLVVYGAPLQAWLARESQRLLPKHQSERVARLLSEYGLYTLAAIVTTFPLTSLLFGRFSLVTLAANPVILPAQPAVMVFGGLAVLLGMVWIPLGQAVAWIAWPFAAFTNRAVEFFAGLPLGDLAVGRFSPAMAIGYYACLALATLWFKIPADRRPRLKLPAASAAFGLAGLLAANGLVWRHALDLPDGRLHLTVLDVDGGDAVLIESPSGRFVLVNGGSSPIQLSEAVGVRLPLFARRLDWVVLSATDDSHVAGLDGIEERFSIGAVLVAGPPGSRAFQSWIGKAAEAGLPLVPAEAGHALDLGDGARLEVAALGERGAILRATYGLASVVMNSVGEPGLVMDLAQQQGIPPATALLLADGGELATNPPPWIQHLSPWVALISVSAGNPRGLPSPELLAVLDGTTVLRTDVNGWIELTTDGERLWVEVERAVE